MNQIRFQPFLDMDYTNLANQSFFLVSLKPTNSFFQIYKRKE